MAKNRFGIVDHVTNLSLCFSLTLSLS